MSPILARVASKWPKLLRNDAKSGFDSSGGPKGLDRLGSWLDLVMGRPTQPIGSNFGIRGVPNFGQGRLKKKLGPIGRGENYEENYPCSLVPLFNLIP